MARRLRYLVLGSLLPLLSVPVRAISVSVVRLGEARIVDLGGAAVLADAATGFDFCLKDPGSGAILRFNSTTGAYVVCGTGVYEQGVGTVTTTGSTVTLVHIYGNRAFQGLHSLDATVNTATGAGQASLNATSESGGTTHPVAITDSNVNDNGDCSSCDSQTAIVEGAINLSGPPTNAFSLNSSQTQFDVLQKYTLNSDFGGNLTRLYGGISRNGAGPLSFQLVIRPDNGGKPGSTPLYVSPTFQYPNFPAFPTIGIVHQDLNLKVGATYWAGYRYNPATNPAEFPFDASPTSADADVYGCAGSALCQKITLNSSTQIRSLFFSADSKYPRQYQSGGLVRYVIPGTIDLLSDKCGDGSYEQILVGSSGITHFYSEPGIGDSTEFPPIEYSNAFVRLRDLSGATDVTGLDGKAETRVGMSRFSGFSYISGGNFNFCTRLTTATDYTCHTIPGYQSGTGHYTRITGVDNGFEASYSNSVADQINRFYLQYGSSGWLAQELNPVRSTPSILSPEFGGNWYQARGWSLGVGYEYKLTSGLIEYQLLDGNNVVGKYSVDQDDPPPSQNPTYATRMAGDCTRYGWCVFGRYDFHTQSNVADILEFEQTTPEIKSYVLSPSPLGFDFGRTVRIDGRDGKAFYGSYTNSSIANQYRLQLDYVDLKTYTKYSLGWDYAAGPGKYPLSFAREGGYYGLGNAKGVNTFYSLTASCGIARLRSHATGNLGTSAGEPPIPCENIPPVGGRTAPSSATAVSVAVTGNGTLTGIGQTSQLTATATLSNASTRDVTGSATWQSSNTGVAMVSASGVVTAVSAGTATITATYQGKSGSLGATVSGSTSSPFANLVGTWSGMWNDTRYNLSGTLSATFTVNGSSVNASGVIGLQAFGMGNASGTGTGTVSGNTLNFTFSSSSVGNGSGTLVSSGAGSGSGTVTGSLNFGAFNFSGTWSGNSIGGNFEFTSPTGGHGTANLAKN